MNGVAIARAVARGARWLDAHNPGWWKEDKITLNCLDLQYPGSCVLGRLQGDFYEACYVHGLDKAEAKHLGFTKRKEWRWSDLTVEWRRVIEERRTQATLKQAS